MRMEAGQATPTAVPPWQGQTGVRRVMAEFKHLHALIQDGKLPQLSELTCVGDKATVWRFKLRDFDEDLPGGAQLNRDLVTLQARHGQDHILMECSFPPDYPTQPPFVRVISPRCVMYTGHVTAGGSICIEALTLSGGPGGWEPSYSIESVLMMVIANMIDCETVYVETVTGPGGLAGPLRVDIKGAHCSNPLQEYTLAEAQQAFRRTADSHRRLGWPKPAAAPPRPPQMDTVPVEAAKGFDTPKAGLEPAAAGASKKARVAEGKAGAASSSAAASQEALLRMREEKRALEKKLQLLESKHSRERGLGLAEPPPHWVITPTTMTGETELIELPLPTAQHPSAGSSPVFPPPRGFTAHYAAARKLAAPTRLPAGGALPPSDDDVMELMANGMSRGEAIQALQQAGGDVMKALMAACAGVPASAVGAAGTAAASGDSSMVDLTGDCSSDSDQDEGATGDESSSGVLAAAASSMWEQESILELTYNGLSVPEALVALDHANGDVDRALQWAAQVAAAGGRGAISKLARRKLRKPASSEAVQRALEQEAESVLAKFAQGGIGRERVVRIERVQSLLLWTDYQRRLLRVSREAGGAANEQQLFHGTSQGSLASIVHHGFDVRASNSGALGCGVYFGTTSSTSAGYCAATGPQRVAPGAAIPPVPPSRPRPGFLPGASAMLLCQVALGRAAPGSGGLRTAPQGYQSCMAGGMYTVYHSDQAYPTWVVHFK